MHFPTIVYRSPGAHPGPFGSSYDYQGVDDEKGLQAAFREGWRASLVDACSADKPVVSLEASPVVESNDDGPPTRAELEAQAVKMGLKFDGRTPDAKLSRMINEAL